MKRRGLLIGGVLAGLLVLAVANWHIFYVDFPYRGKIIDKETKQPIEGAAVVAVWRMVTLNNFVQGVISIYEAHETVTDREGNFTTPWIWGGSINPLQKVRPPLFTIFKPGYAVYGSGSIKPIAVPKYMRLYKSGGRTVVELQPLKTRKERLEHLRKIFVRICMPDIPGIRSDLPPNCILKEQLPNLIRLKDLEQSQLAKKRKRRRALSPSSRVLSPQEVLPPPGNIPQQGRGLYRYGIDKD